MYTEVVCFYCLSPCDWCKPLSGWWCSRLKISELAQGFSDCCSISGSQETFCIKHKGFFMFLSASTGFLWRTGIPQEKTKPEKLLEENGSKAPGASLLLWVYMAYALVGLSARLQQEQHAESWIIKWLSCLSDKSGKSGFFIVTHERGTLETRMIMIQMICCPSVSSFHKYNPFFDCLYQK